MVASPCTYALSSLSPRVNNAIFSGASPKSDAKLEGKFEGKLSVAIPISPVGNIQLVQSPREKTLGRRRGTDPTPFACEPPAPVTRSLSDLDILKSPTFKSPGKLHSSFSFEKKRELFQKNRRSRARSLTTNLSSILTTPDKTLTATNFAALLSPTTSTPTTLGHTPGHSRKGSHLRTGSTDRFIPSRKDLDKTVQLHNMSSKENTHQPCPALSQLSCCTPNCPTHEIISPVAQSKQDFNAKLSEALLGIKSSSTAKILSFGTPEVRPVQKTHQDGLREIYSSNLTEKKKPKARYISNTPERILDAPELLDDYYLNLLDWSSTNILAVGLGANLYLWNAASGTIDQLVENSDPENFITSVSWGEDGRTIAVGSTDTTIQIWDVDAKKQTDTRHGHMLRVSSLAWHSSLLASGSRDATIVCHDIRAGGTVATLRGHEEEICGLTWSKNGQLASGGNDNICCIWEKGSFSEPKHLFREHTAAVKALAWCPFQDNVLATGGGTADRHIRFFNTMTGVCINAIDTKSQVCSLIWSKHSKELLSAHGFSQNQLTLWKFPSMTQVANLTGHTSRVLHTALSPDGTTVCSAAADETLRFWNVWEPAQTTNSHKRINFTSMLTRNIR